MPAGGDAIPPGGTIGILGGGQLGRMLALAAAELGQSTVVLCPDEDAPAFQVTGRHLVASYEDEEALADLARQADVVTYEFENVPEKSARFLAERVPVRPGADALAVAQDRLAEKNFLAGLGIETAPFAAVASLEDLGTALAALGTPAVLKTRRFGYDGKGQVLLKAKESAAEAWKEIGAAPAILEGFVRFEREISVIVARGTDGAIASYDPVENAHDDHILHRTLVPAPLSEKTADEARRIAGRIVEALGYVGVMGVEMFLRDDGHLLVNEIAPRVHNSGHWTSDACLVSQFEQHIRAVCGWPLGSPERHSDALMQNLLGDEAACWRQSAAEGDVAIHLYGKAEARPGRKMGHITRLYPKGERPPA